MQQSNVVLQYSLRLVELVCGQAKQTFHLDASHRSSVWILNCWTPAVPLQLYLFPLLSGFSFPYFATPNVVHDHCGT